MDQNAPARRRAAFHEAGHVIVGWALGLKIGWVRLIGEDAGKADIALDTDKLSLVDQIAVAMGGAYGADLSGVEPLHDLETFSDMGHALDATYQYFSNDQDYGGAFSDALHRAGCARAEELVNRHVDLVALVANELLRHGEILEGEVARLLPQVPDWAASRRHI